MDKAGVNQNTLSWEDGSVRLERLKDEHLRLLAPLFEPEFCRYYPKTYNTLLEYHDDILKHKLFGDAQIFAIVGKKSGMPLGWTGYFPMDKKNLNVEFGFSWLRRSSRGTSARAEYVLLLVENAIENWGDRPEPRGVGHS